MAWLFFYKEGLVNSCCLNFSEDVSSYNALLSIICLSITFNTCLYEGFTGTVVWNSTKLSHSELPGAGLNNSQHIGKYNCILFKTYLTSNKQT